MNALERFSDHNSRNTKAFSLNGITSYARVVKVVDGDTIKVVLPLQFATSEQWYTFNVRLKGIDCCEISSACDINRQTALRAKQRLVRLITGGMGEDNDDVQFDDAVFLVWLKAGRMDKYGRVIGNVYADETETCCFSTVLLNENLAFPYNGSGKRMSESEQLRYLSTTEKP